MKIRHREYGDVDGVEGSAFYGGIVVEWSKRERASTTAYKLADGWAAVDKPKHVDVTENARVSCDRDLSLFGYNGDILFTTTKVLPVQYVLRKVYWFDLPETIFEDIQCLDRSEILAYVELHKKPCLIVEKEES